MNEGNPFANAAAADDRRKRKRRKSGTAKRHLAASAVDTSVREILAWSDRECLDFLVKVRFGSWKTVICPHCGTIGKHAWKKNEKRWRCTGCRSSFSITSGSHFHARKLPLREIVAQTLTFLCNVGGHPALALRREYRHSYNTAYVHQQKLREGLIRGHNIGLLNADVEMDAAHQSGRRSAEKRGRPQVTPPLNKQPDALEKEKAILEGAGKDPKAQPPLTDVERINAKNRAKKGGQRDPDYGKRLPPDRRLVFTVRKRSGVKRQGAVATRIGVGRTEDVPEAKAMVGSFVAMPESVLNSDMVKAYAPIGRKFADHRRVEHALTFSGPNGENNNQAEEINARMDRAEKGVYLNIEPKYLHDYACEVGFRSDARRLSNGKQLQLLLHIAMSVGRSEFWTMYTHGQHRDIEILMPANAGALPSGPPAGTSPIAMKNGKPPR
ncbi:MAG: IS1595 family transposase [Burkholderiales bacterium]